MKKLILSAMVGAAMMSASANCNAARIGNGATTTDTLIVTPTPQMHCENCEKRIKNNIRFVKGTKKITTSVPNQTVTIIYDNTKATKEDYEKAFKSIGYEIKTKQ